MTGIGTRERLAFDGREAKLTSQFHPVGAYKSGREYYLLGQYWFNRELFQWHAWA